MGRDLATNKIIEYLVCEKPGEKRAVEGRIVHLRHHGVTVAIWGKSAVLYYFEDRQYKSVISSD